MGILRRYFARPATERRLFRRAVLVLGAVRLGLLVLPFRTVARLVGRLARPQAGADIHVMLRDQIVWAVERANRFVPGRGTCLHEALAGHLMLARGGFQTSLRIGVKKGDAGELIAHAWVEDGGAVVIGGPASEITEYATLKNLDRIGFNR